MEEWELREGSEQRQARQTETFNSPHLPAVVIDSEGTLLGQNQTLRHNACLEDCIWVTNAHWIIREGTDSGKEAKPKL